LDRDGDVSCLASYGALRVRADSEISPQQCPSEATPYQAE
jgi:hypothetical protein